MINTTSSAESTLIRSVSSYSLLFIVERPTKVAPTHAAMVARKYLRRRRAEISGPCDAYWMTYAEDPQSYMKRLKAKLEPDRIRSTLAFAGLYQMTHEMIKHTVIDDVKGFYGHSAFGGGTWMGGDNARDRYKRDVLDLAPKQPFNASLEWLRRSEAISSAQVARLEEIYDHRHELTHELAKFVVDVNAEPDVDLLTDAVQIMRELSRFWVQIEIDIGTFEDHGDVDVAAVHPGSLLVLDLCIQAYVDGLGLSPSDE